MSVTELRRYKAVKSQILAERGHRCEACGAYAEHPHHIIPVSETGIAAELTYEPANILILCDDCHALMHPKLRNVAEWMIGRKDRYRALHRM